MDYSYRRNEVIIKKKTREFFGVGTVVTASSYLVLVLDFMLIGWILGSDAVAAAALCDSFVDLAEFPGFVFSSGGPILAGILLGKRKFSKANQVFTLSLLLTLAASLLCWCLLPFCGFFGNVLSNNGGIGSEVSRYAFFCLAGAPFVGIELVLTGFAVLDNHSNLAMGSVVTANVVNVILDVVFMKYLGFGVAGASLASMLGNAMGILVCLPYLLSKNRAFHFELNFKELWETCRELFASCTSFAVDKISRIVSGLIVNVTLMYFVGNIGVALYAIFGRLKFILKIIAGGALQTISTLGSILYGERDFFGLGRMMSILLKYTYSLLVAFELVLFFISKQFLLSYGIEPLKDTMLAFRIMLLSLPIYWLNDLLSRFYPIIQRQKLSVMLLACQNVVFRIPLLLLCAFAIVKLHLASLPLVAVWCFLVELVSFAFIIAFEKHKYSNIALFGIKGFSSPDCHIFSITGDAENVADIHREIESFCIKNGISRKKGTLLAIAFEEAALYIINQNKKVDMIDICLLLENGNLLVRIRDDGFAFNPLDYVDDNDILRQNNINLLDRLTNQKTYTRIMNMNNTVLSINLENDVNG